MIRDQYTKLLIRKPDSTSGDHDDQNHGGNQRVPPGWSGEDRGHFEPKKATIDPQKPAKKDIARKSSFCVKK